MQLQTYVKREIRGHSTRAMVSSYKKRSFQAAFTLKVVEYDSNNNVMSLGPPEHRQNKYTHTKTGIQTDEHTNGRNTYVCGI